MALMIPCFVCSNDFQFSDHLYAGRHIDAYNINVCDGCCATNLDGWGPYAEKRLLAHLNAEGLPVPERNEKDWLPFDPA
jgi:hypothetical protein